MPLTDTYTAACRLAVSRLPELTSFRSAGATSAETRAARTAQGSAQFANDSTGTSPAFRLRQAIRNTVNAEGDKHTTAGSGVITAADREATYQTLVAEFVPDVDPPISSDAEYAALEALIKEEYLS
jgi:hypothetical protein